MQIGLLDTRPFSDIVELTADGLSLNNLRSKPWALSSTMPTHLGGKRIETKFNFMAPEV
uniref:Uncharacterized protein n=1 Tax=Rhizophagus irregularis (strain DAOM 181602 / DAOM 197198 / MUCL 43194) TaxID=747089 RepID=U9SV34_RHIID